MRILVIPDIHLKTWIFDRAEDILKASKADQHCGVTAIMM